VITVEQALSRILAVLPAPVPEEAALADAAHRIVITGITATIDLPPFDNSAMDGYAVRSADLRSVNQGRPAKLLNAGSVAAGSAFNGMIKSGECVRIFTGSPLPKGADAVVMQEDTHSGSGPSEVLVCEAAKPWENVRLRGGDVKCGQVIVKGGERLTAARLGLLASVGVETVTVARRPRVALLATGSELCDPGRPLSPGQIYESNRLALATLVHQTNGDALVQPIVQDSFEAPRQALKQALEESDILITTGGVSVGEYDFVKAAFENMGGSIEFWRVAMRPGKPFVFGRWQNKFLFGLPGNAVSAFVTFLILVRPALLRLQGVPDVEMSSSSGVLAEPVRNQGDRRHFMRVCVDSDGKVYSSGLQASHAQSSLATANGLLDLAPNASKAAGEVVTVLRWD